MRFPTRTIKLQGAEPWGIATYGDGVPYPLSYADVERDTEGAVRALGALEVGAGDTVLVVSRLEEGGHFWPFNAAVAQLGMLGLCADATLFDAARTEMLLRRFDVKVAVGVNRAVIDGLELAGFTPASVFGRAKLIVARTDAAPLIAAMGVPVRRWQQLGPTYAMDCSLGRLHVDTAQWDVSVDRDELVVRARQERAVGADPIATGVAGTVDKDGCSCSRGKDGTISLAM
jgi:hypothetical protein